MAAPEPVVILTGASAGIGMELARVFARNGHRLVLIARRGERLSVLSHEIVAAGHAEPLVLALDLQQPGMADIVDAELVRHGLEPQYVVNNAGFGLVGEAQYRDRTEQLQMIDLNIRTLTDFSLRWIEQLARRNGGLLNVSSVAGFLPGPGSAVYYASKAYVLSFTQALHRELKSAGVRVTALCPGPVPTEFQDRAGVAEDHAPRALTVSATRVAEEGYRGLMAGRRIVVPGFLNKVVTFLPRVVPPTWLLDGVHARQRRRADLGR
jgi:short-subunit dehydrogenase